MEPVRYFQVNWADGMKINKDHFIALENVFNDKIRDNIATGINDYNYGLLPPLPGKSSSIKVAITADNENIIKVKLLECRAITPGGARIEILEDYQDAHGFTVPLAEAVLELEGSKATDFYVLLTIQPFSRVPVGNADPSEEPPRYPYAVPEIKLHMMSSDQMAAKEMGSYYLSIGKMKLVNGQLEIDTEYIPPCCSVQSHSQLKDMHGKFDEFFSKLELNFITLLRKIKEKEQNHDLANAVSFLSSNMLAFLSNSILEYRWIDANLPPVVMFEKIARCARILKNEIDANAAEIKEELMNYIAEWCNLNPGEFEKILIDAIDFRYEHIRIRDTVFVMDQFAKVTSEFFDKLSALEYIGKKKDTGIFVKEQKQQNKSSFLAE